QGNLVHVIASDAHDVDSRKPELAFVPSLLHKVFPDKIALFLNDIPAAILADEAVPDIGEPHGNLTKRSFFDFFKKRES
ncbi:MAG: hypothetical protein PHX05_10250, partial [Acidobacteriota bacterium]|nr:hypothetical protein [Acidobacteriota bacterium]